MNTRARPSVQPLWPATQWREQAIRLGRYLGLLPDAAPVLPPTRRQLLLAAQDRRRAESRRAADMTRSQR
jgi:hypothetical protein